MGKQDYLPSWIATGLYRVGSKRYQIDGCEFIQCDPPYYQIDEEYARVLERKRKEREENDER